MPRVPESPGPQVQTRPIGGGAFGVRSTPEDFGAGIGRAISGVADLGAKRLLKEQERANTIAVQDLESEYRRLENDLLLGDEGALNIQGKDAVTVPQTYMERRQGAVEKLREKAANDVQRQAFDAIVSRYTPVFEASLLKHSKAQMISYEDDLFSSMTESFVEAGGMYSNDQPRLALERERFKSAVASHAATRGWSNEKTNQYYRSNLSKMHLGVVLKATDDNELEYAQEYMRQFGDSMEPAERGSAKKVLDAQVQKVDSLDRALAYQASGVSEIDAIRDARAKIDDPDLLSATVSQIKTVYGEQEAAERQREEDAADAAWNVIAGGGGQGSIPASVWASLNPRTKVTIQRHLEAGGGPGKQNDAIWYPLVQKMQDPEFAHDVDLMQYRPHLNQSHFDQLVGMQLKARSGQEFTQKDIADIEQANIADDLIKEALTAGGIVPEKQGDKKYSAQYQEYARDFRREVLLRQQDVKRPLTQEETIRAMDDVVLRKSRGEDFEDFGRPLVPINQIPREDRQQIENLLRSRGLPTSDWRIERAYAARVTDNIELLRMALDPKR